MYTYCDAIDHAVDYVGGTLNAAQQRDVRGAVLSAYQSLAQLRRWSYYHAQFRLVTFAPYAAGSISYSASTRVVTLLGGVWPEWAGDGTLVAGNMRAPVRRRLGDTELELVPELAFPFDMPAGTQYRLVADTYALPATFREMAHPRLAIGGQHMDPQSMEFIAARRLVGGEGVVGRPQYYAVGEHPWRRDVRALHLWPAPNTTGALDANYYRMPAPLTLTGYGSQESQGTVSGTSGGSMVTGAGTAFGNWMVGSVIRFSASTALPDGPGGMNPAREEFIVRSVQSPTQLLIEGQLAYDYAGARWRVSSRLDIADYMYETLLRTIELELIRRRRMSGVEAAIHQQQMALHAAAQADAPIYEPRTLYEARRAWPTER